MIYKPNILLCCSSASFILTSLYGYKKQQYMYQFDLVSRCVLWYIGVIQTIHTKEL